MNRINKNIFMNIYNLRLSLLLFILFIFSKNGITQGYSNITISTSNTSGGAWSGTTFIPSANSSIIKASEIVTKLGAGDVIISNTTSCLSCTQSGTISITTPITVTLVSARTLFINSQKDVSINSSINLSSSLATTNTRSTSLKITSESGNIISTITSGTINTSRTANEDNEHAGNVTLIATNGSVQINADINAYAPTAKSGGLGGDVSIYGNTGITIKASINTTSNTSGKLSITDNNLLISDGITNFSNLGQSSGIFKVASFENLGTGTFMLKGANVWTGNTTLSGSGSLMIGANNSIPTTSSIIFNGGDLKPNGFTNSVVNIDIKNNSSITFDAAQSSSLTFTSATTSATNTATTFLTINGWQGFSQSIALTKNGYLATSSSDFVTTNGALQNVTNPGGITQYGQILTSAVGGSGGLKGKIFSTAMLSGTSLTTIKNQMRFYNATESKYYKSTQISTKEIIPGAAY